MSTSYPATSLEQARKFVQQRQSGLRPTPDDFVQVRGAGESAGDAVENLGDALVDSGLRNLGGGAFDAAVRPVVHQHLAGVGEQALSDGDFWRYLAAVRFYDVVSRRHPKSNKSASAEGIDGNWANYGALRADPKESLFFRLYFGAELAYDAEATDPYHLARVSDVDLWQSHIIRVMSGDNPLYVRALLEWFRDRAAWKARTGMDVDGLFTQYNKEPETRHLRDLVKRVRRLRSNVVHESLALDEVRQLVDQEATRSLMHIAAWGRFKD
jgi:hypothetical protein